MDETKRASLKRAREASDRDEEVDTQQLIKLLPPTEENPLGLNTAQLPKIHLLNNMKVHDVVLEEDIPLIATIAQMMLIAYKGLGTPQMMINHDRVDNAYDISITYPWDTYIDKAYIDAIYMTNSYRILEGPGTQGVVHRNNETNAPVHLQSMKIRVASHQRRTVKVTKTALLVYQKEYTHVIEKKQRPAKRQRRDSM